MLADQFFKGAQQAQMILSRLQIAYGEDERASYVEFSFHGSSGNLALDGPEYR